MLEVRGLSAAYGSHPALQDVSLTVNRGEIVVILGANGAGKSTLLRAIAGVCEGSVSGDVLLSGQSIVGLSSDAIVEQGLALVPEGRGIFGDLSVKENLLLGAYSQRARSSEAENLERILRLFPQLVERQKQIARTMSGGEQQMVAVGRAMMSAPQILMLDEPSLGLSPLLCKELFRTLKQIKTLNIGVLLVEQNARQSLAIADRGYLLENTRISRQESASNLANDPAVQQAYLGGGAASTQSRLSPSVLPSITDSASRNASGVSSVQFTPAMGEIRRSADQQIGGSIEEIVSRAAQTSQVAHGNTESDTAGVGVNTSTVSASRYNVKAVTSRSEVEKVVRDLEQAAKQARKRAGALKDSSFAPTNNSMNSNTRNGLTKQENNNGIAEQTAPPVIEVYKRPRVEVYRRRPSGEIERN